MWAVQGNDLTMCVGDWGVELPITVNGATITAHDSMKFTLKIGNTSIVKDYSDIQQNTIRLSFTEEESALLSVGNYAYSLDWYQDGAFLCNVIPTARIKVVEKA